MTDLLAELAEVVRLDGMLDATGAAHEALMFLRANHAELTRILADDAAIRAAHHDLVIRLGEVTTELEAANALLRECVHFIDYGGAADDDLAAKIDAHLSENGHD